MGKQCCRKEVVTTDQAPKPIGPYSAAVKGGLFLFTAGQIGIDPQTGEIVHGGVEAETRQVMKNIRALLEAAGTSFERVVKTTIFLRDMNDFAKVNAIYGEFFPSEPPARSTVQVAGLPKGAAVEIEVVALLAEDDPCC
ncbi:MAG: reactive intermediate/imine deaminase [Bellilinea sp.]|nr:MAG: reactive intermediate/imine deaminase [Bellilinea sp.]